MTTFGEMQDRLAKLIQSRDVVVHLMEHLDENFRPNGDQPPKSILLTDKKERIEQPAFDYVVDQLLCAQLASLNKEIGAINSMVFSEPKTEAPPDATNGQQAAFVPGSSPKTKRASQAQ